MEDTATIAASPPYPHSLEHKLHLQEKELQQLRHALQDSRNRHVHPTARGESGYEEEDYDEDMVGMEGGKR